MPGPNANGFASQWNIGLSFLLPSGGLRGCFFLVFFILFTSQYTSRSSSVIAIWLDQRKGNNITYV